MFRYSCYLLFVLCIVSCVSKKETETTTDSTTVSQTTDTLAVASGPWLDLDIEHIKTYSYTDTTITFADPAYNGPHDLEEPESIKTDSRVKRTEEGLIFKLKNGQTKTLKNTDTQDQDYASYVFQKKFDDVNQWLVFAIFFESHGFVMIDQNDGTETWMWSEPTFSPDKKYFLCGSADIEAGFVPNGFQLWTFQDGKPTKLWDKELTDWGAESLIWAKDDVVFGNQVYRDAELGEANQRIVRMKLFWNSSPKSPAP
ncbi:hypothetical protein [Chryseolinea lacunae]|uniref:Uncharacterized protein n=1 Tax=Chryseolinea lacunae TaxID=2801331 RepID=A0ABS1KU31_9BACT|nr:hypothetical protein [Chryseolinea lacunae]MBL0741831.1 hypothetical protein [Chryseolinea lacunae]